MFNVVRKMSASDLAWWWFSQCESRLVLILLPMFDIDVFRFPGAVWNGCGLSAGCCVLILTNDVGPVNSVLSDQDLSPFWKSKSFQVLICSTSILCLLLQSYWLYGLMIILLMNAGRNKWTYFADSLIQFMKKVNAYYSRSLIGNDDSFSISCQKRMGDLRWLNSQTVDVEAVDGINKMNHISPAVVPFSFQAEIILSRP